ncbi:hypothetical protein [Jiangella alkaliphila]|uniref:Uncharacterized protein n=1 Tax=Jiangella alkaliphila TaxID=419479 RepID=A0A1H2M1P3_9ACTN|nr:hypothetical protein [Jiangella alkaliphila]SDU86888.1 hypothetical protein SAMN04488563_6936 [Jiangella alkaliphila]
MFALPKGDKERIVPSAHWVAQFLRLRIVAHTPRPRALSTAPGAHGAATEHEACRDQLADWLRRLTSSEG